ncbi:MAG: hypothetical protein Q4C49_07320 [Bacillota bacterium]|nr:hypothetical protein [Bacillota bacterium]
MDIQAISLVGGIGLILTIIVSLVPTNIASFIGQKLSFQKKGLHYSRFYRDQRDLLGNLLLFVTILYSFCFGFIPISIEKYCFTILYVFCFIVMVTQYFHAYSQKELTQRIPTISALCLLSVTNYIAASGFLNNFGLMYPSMEFIQSIQNGNIYRLTYFLAYNHFICYMLNIFLYFFSFYCLIAQFKYLRLEDCVKAKNAVLLWLKAILISIFMLGLSYYGYQFILFIFNIQ